MVTSCWSSAILLQMFSQLLCPGGSWIHPLSFFSMMFTVLQQISGVIHYLDKANSFHNFRIYELNIININRRLEDNHPNFMCKQLSLAKIL